MHKFDWQVLEALYRASTDNFSQSDLQLVPVEAYPSQSDEQVWQVGQALFGESFGGELQEGKEDQGFYARQVYLSLGRLAKRGLVIKEPLKGCNYSLWLISPYGRSLAKGMSDA